jgi:hypothetical protein
MKKIDDLEDVMDIWMNSSSVCYDLIDKIWCIERSERQELRGGDCQAGRVNTNPPRPGKNALKV